MKKIVNVLLGAVVFGFVGCGGGNTPQGAAGLPNDGMIKVPDANTQNQSQGQTIDGIWYIFSERVNNQINLEKVSNIWEFDNSGSIYDMSTTNKVKIATYGAVSNTKLKLTDLNNANIVETVDFLRLANEEGNCFYTNRVYSNNGQQEELWCKKPEINNQENLGNSNTGDMRPQILQEVGFPVDLKDYLYPTQTLDNGGKTSEYVYNYNIEQDGKIYFEARELRSFDRVYDGQNNVVREFINHSTQSSSEDVIDQNNNRITSYDRNDNGGFDTEVFPYSVNKNSVVSEYTDSGVTLLCVVQDILASADLSSEIPEAMRNDVLGYVTGSSNAANQFNYLGVVHIHCGATNGTTIDSYNVNGRGNVLTIIKHSDNTSRYEILDKNSLQHN